MQTKFRKLTGFKSGTTLDEMLHVKSFEQLLKDGDVLDVRGAAAKTGYTVKHIHRLCRENRIGHVRRGLTSDESQFYFLAWQLKQLFTYQKARA